MARAKPRGVFTCGCGFTYLRVGPDRSANDRFRYDSIQTHGPQWETLLREKWLDSTLSFKQLAILFKTSEWSLKRVATQFGLLIPRPRGRKPLEATITAVQNLHVQVVFETKREKYRRDWLTALEEHPTMRKADLHSMLPNVYYWLLRYDHDWLLNEHKRRSLLQGRRRRTISPQYWKERDCELATSVRSSAERLTQAVGYPIHITKFSIGADLHKPGLLYGQLQNLPLTAQALEEVVETRETYAVRRIWWIADYYRREHILPTRSQLMKRIGIRPVAQRPEVKNAIDAALAMLETS